ncbi:MAG TPA: hypothetical protein V6C57_15455 [Coleofasciculaceae cyanobacterium]
MKEPVLAPLEVPLNRVQDMTQIQYTSAIALKLARQDNPIHLAQEIACRLNQMIAMASAKATCPQDRIWQNFTIQTVLPGWIYLQLDQQGTAEWLQTLVSQPMHLSSDQTSTSSFATTANIRDYTHTFCILYTHARCCSLLRSANTEGIIRLNAANFGQAAANPSAAHLNGNLNANLQGNLNANLNIVAPQPLPWLTSGELQCQHPAERQLITQIVDVLDALSQPGDRPLEKLAQALSQDFETFYAACRIWGDVKSTNLPLAQVRLGLVLITQKLLWVLLHRMQREAPTEL